MAILTLYMFTSAVALLRSGDLALEVNDDLGFTLSVAGSQWLLGTAFTANDGKRLSPSDGTLVATGPLEPISGSDALGDFSGVTRAHSSATGDFEWVGTIRAYEQEGGNGVVAFRQEYPRGANGTAAAAHGGNASTAFPALHRPPGAASPFGFLEWRGASAGTNRLRYTSLLLSRAALA